MLPSTATTCAAAAALRSCCAAARPCVASPRAASSWLRRYSACRQLAFASPSSAPRRAAASPSSSSPSPPRPAPRCSLTADQIQLLRSSVLYEDDQLCVLNKPAGLAVHAGTDNESRHLTGMLWALQPASASSSSSTPATTTMHLVHRLDKETSGCILLAKDAATARLLSDLLAAPAKRTAAAPAVQHSIHAATTASALPVYSPSVWRTNSDTAVPFMSKQYVAVVHGRPTPSEGSMTSPSGDGWLCHSSYREVAHSKGSADDPAFSVLELIPHTGRKRQLRLHCHGSLGCPLLGEQLVQLKERAAHSVSLQQKQRKLDERGRRFLQQTIGSTPSSSDPLPLFLHAASLRLQHPLLHGGKPLTVRAPLPQHFAAVLKALQR